MLEILFRHTKLIFTWGVLVAVLSIAVSLLFPWRYSATSQVLIISRDKSGIDPYTQSKAAERIGENLAQVMKTQDFMQKVMDVTDPVFDKAYWQNLTPRNQLKQWSKQVVGEMMYGTSLMSITVYSGKDDVNNLATAVTSAITTHGWEYVGGDVSIMTVNAPIVSRWIAQPNILINGLLGFLEGILLSAAWVIKSKRHLFGM